MELTRTQFDILVALCAGKNTTLTQRRLKDLTGYSLGAINKTVQDLTKNGLAKSGAITPKGLQALEPYRAKRAIFLAAGFGARLVPVTLNTPKPLVHVNGVRIIDTLIDACLSADIEEIYIVRGYLAKEFDCLLEKYPAIKFIENPKYNEANNILSAVLARHLMQDAYVLEADLLVSNPKIIRKYNYRSNVLGIYKERTDDWCFSEKNGIVIEEKVGGVNCYQMVGIYYFNHADGLRLTDHLKDAYEAPGGKERYWETVPNQVYKGQYKIEIIPCNQEDIVEIDTYNELKAIDKNYDV